MPAEKIGKARCPLCGGTADVSLSKSRLVVLTMNCCQAQLFTRSDRSDDLVRRLIIRPEPGKVEDTAPPAAPAAAAPEAPASGSPGEPPAAPPQTVQTEKKRSPFGLLGV